MSENWLALLFSIVTDASADESLSIAKGKGTVSKNRKEQIGRSYHIRKYKSESLLEEVSFQGHKQLGFMV